MSCPASHPHPHCISLPCVSQRDYLILEDHSGRVLLSGSISSMTNELVSGIVVALRGRVDETGHFAVTQELFSYDVADAADAASSPVALPRRIPQTARLVLLASGLALGGTVSAAAAAAVANGGDADLSMQLLVDFICGRLADPESAEVSSRIVRYAHTHPITPHLSICTPSLHSFTCPLSDMLIA